MIKKCPKCGAERQQDDMIPSYGCPSCGIIYAKYEKILNQQNTAQNASPMKAPDINRSQPKIQKPVKKLVNPIIVVSVVIALAISFIGYKFYLNIEKRNSNRGFSFIVEAISWRMINLAIDSETVVGEINRAWREAIFSKYEKRNFNDAIREVQLNRADDIASIKRLSEEIAENIKK